MIGGKTAALLATSMQLGALLGGAPKDLQNTYHQLGINVGLAFQVHDDILGIWGNTASTGKSTATDLITRKKSLPILFGLEQQGKFADMWEAQITPDNVSALCSPIRSRRSLGLCATKSRRVHPRRPQIAL